MYNLIGLSIRHSRRDQFYQARCFKAKALDDALRQPKNPHRHLTPSGTLKRDGQELARQEATARRVDISKQLESTKAELEAKKERETQREKSHSIELGR